MKQHACAFAAALIFASVNSYEESASAQVNDTCNQNYPSGSPCVNASQTGSGSEPALQANCDNSGGEGSCALFKQTGTGATNNVVSIDNNSTASPTGSALFVENLNGGGIWAEGGGASLPAYSGSIIKSGVVAAGITYGVYGTSTGGIGVEGVSTSTHGVVGIASSSSTVAGVVGENTVNGTASFGVYGVIYPEGVGNAIYGENNSTASGAFAGYFDGSIQVNGTPYCKGCTAFTNNSDSRLKKNVQPLSGSLDVLLKLHGVAFEWKDPEEQGHHSGVQRGFIAQDVEKVLPEWVGVDANGFKTLNTTGLEPMVVESLRTLKAENDALRDRVNALEAGRRPVALGFFGNRAGFGLAGLVLGGAFVASRKKRSAASA
jgi:endosialidase-like protein